jgi:hypothetical protein
MKRIRLVIGIALIAITSGCGGDAFRNAIQTPDASEFAASESEHDASVMKDSGGDRHSQVTTRSFQAVEGGSEFRQSDGVIVTVRPRDTIPAILDPIFVGREEARHWMEDDEPVLGLEIGNDARAYPLNILSWHEIVNDTVGGVPVAVTW